MFKKFNELSPFKQRQYNWFLFRSHNNSIENTLREILLSDEDRLIKNIISLLDINDVDVPIESIINLLIYIEYRDAKEKIKKLLTHNDVTVILSAIDYFDKLNIKIEIDDILSLFDHKIIKKSCAIGESAIDLIIKLYGTDGLSYVIPEYINEHSENRLNEIVMRRIVEFNLQEHLDYIIALSNSKIERIRELSKKILDDWEK